MIIEGYCCSWSHSMTHTHTHTHTHKHTQTVRVFWMSYRPVEETSTWQHTTLTREKQPWNRPGFKPSIPWSERPQSGTFNRSTTSVPIVKGKGKAVPLKARYGQEGSRKFKLPDFHNILHMKVVRLSALHTGCLYLQEISLVLIFARGWVDPRAMLR